MNFEIPVDTYIRLSAVTKYIRSDIPEDQRNLLKCVRIEYKDGHCYALASNRRIAAVYYFGNVGTLENGSVHLAIDEKLLAQCEIEKAFNSKLHIIAMPELNIVTLKTTMGYQIANAGFFSSNTPLQNWRSWGPGELAKQTKGAMAWTMWDMEQLNCASPSGRIVFPEFIDANKPVLVRDLQYPEWVGLFNPVLIDDKGKAYTAEPATIPAWW